MDKALRLLLIRQRVDLLRDDGRMKPPNAVCGAVGVFDDIRCLDVARAPQIEAQEAYGADEENDDDD